MLVGKRHGEVRYPPFWPGLVITLRNLVRAYAEFLGNALRPMPTPVKGRFAFVVHPRELSDVYRLFPALRHFGFQLGSWFALLIPPLQASYITLGKRPSGILLTNLLTPEMMARFPKLAAIQATATAVLGAKKGAHIIGLGALNPMLTQYGLRVQPKLEHARITIGHAYTAATIVEQLIGVSGGTLTGRTIAICGSAGSTGSATARGLLAILPDQVQHLVLIDRRSGRNVQLAQELGALHRNCIIEVSDDLADAVKGDFVVVVTNAPNAIIRPEHLKRGAIVLDDSQPRNTDPSLLAARSDVRIYDVLAEVPQLDVNFDWGLLTEQPSITFTCLAETIALTQMERPDLTTVGHVSGERVKQVLEVARAAGIGPAPLTTFYRRLPDEPRPLHRAHAAQGQEMKPAVCPVS